MVAHNEAARIGDRVLNLLNSDYPPERLSVLVVSDGSTDTTAQAATVPDPRVQVIALPERRGKAAGLNRALAEATGEVVVFADARQRFQADTVRRLAGAFADPAVGAVSGALTVAAGQGAVGEGMGTYWALEKRLREGEAAIDSCIGCTGAVYAIRRSLFEPLPEDTILDDVVIPMRIALKKRDEGKGGRGEGRRGEVEGGGWKVEGDEFNVQRPTSNVQRSTPNGQGTGDRSSVIGDRLAVAGEQSSARATYLGTPSPSSARVMQNPPDGNTQRPTLNAQRPTSNIQRSTPNGQGTGDRSSVIGHRLAETTVPPVPGSAFSFHPSGHRTQATGHRIQEAGSRMPDTGSTITPAQPASSASACKGFLSCFTSTVRPNLTSGNQYGSPTKACSPAIHHSRFTIHDSAPPFSGYRILFDPDAVAIDPQALDPGKEVIRKRRTLAGNFQMLFRHPQWLLPWRNRLWWQLVSHKYLRLCGPVLLVLALTANIVLVVWAPRPERPLGNSGNVEYPTSNVERPTGFSTSPRFAWTLSVERWTLDVHSPWLWFYRLALAGQLSLYLLALIGLVRASPCAGKGALEGSGSGRFDAPFDCAQGLLKALSLSKGSLPRRAGPSRSGYFWVVSCLARLRLPVFSCGGARMVSLAAGFLFLNVQVVQGFVDYLRHRSAGGWQKT